MRARLARDEQEGASAIAQGHDPGIGRAVSAGSPSVSKHFTPLKSHTMDAREVERALWEFQ